mmetsp:Transcript_18305/g.62166  ORF Transcript_18305/g.62166 Transcript_18305/m.62166 type:complete len:388 (+) Transcript_18305:1224-2387(+)
MMATGSGWAVPGSGWPSIHRQSTSASASRASSMSSSSPGVACESAASSSSSSASITPSSDTRSSCFALSLSSSSDSGCSVLKSSALRRKSPFWAAMNAISLRSVVLMPRTSIELETNATSAQLVTIATVLITSRTVRHAPMSSAPRLNGLPVTFTTFLASRCTSMELATAAMPAPRGKAGAKRTTKPNWITRALYSSKTPPYGGRSDSLTDSESFTVTSGLSAFGLSGVSLPASASSPLSAFFDSVLSTDRLRMYCCSCFLTHGMTFSFTERSTKPFTMSAVPSWTVSASMRLSRHRTSDASSVHSTPLIDRPPRSSVHSVPQTVDPYSPSLHRTHARVSSAGSYVSGTTPLQSVSGVLLITSPSIRSSQSPMAALDSKNVMSMSGK